MISGEEIIKSLQAEMAKYEDEYNLIEKEIKETTVNYNDMMSKLLTKKEQVRGSYTALYNQVQKLAGNAVAEPAKEADVEEVTETKAEEPIDVPVETGLSAEDIAKITKVTKQKTTSKKAPVADVPDYLKEEYGV